MPIIIFFFFIFLIVFAAVSYKYGNLRGYHDGYKMGYDAASREINRNPMSIKLDTGDSYQNYKNGYDKGFKDAKIQFETQQKKKI